MSTQGYILAVDDDATFLGELKQALASDFRVKTALGVSPAMKAIHEQKPDLILLDMNMPQVSGMDFLKVVRQRSPEIPVIMLTADSNPIRIVEAIKSGARDYVIKGSEDFVSGLRVRVAQAVKLSNFQKENEQLSQKIKADSAMDFIVDVLYCGRDA